MRIAEFGAALTESERRWEMRNAECWWLSTIPQSAIRDPHFTLRFTFEVMPTDGDCGWWSLGSEPLRESFVADSKSQMQRDPTSSLMVDRRGS